MDLGPRAEFCVVCGARNAGERYCPTCGAEVPWDPRAQPQADPVVAGESTEGAGRSGWRPSRRWLVVGTVTVAVAALVGVGVALVSARTKPASASIPTATAPVPTGPSATQQAPTPAAADVVDVRGRYTGRMIGLRGIYDFEMSLRQSGEKVVGTVWQTHNDGRYAGTERVRGTLTGRQLYLISLGWTSDTDPAWAEKRDTYRLTFTGSGSAFQGRFKCDICDTGWRPIRGRR